MCAGQTTKLITDATWSLPLNPLQELQHAQIGKAIAAEDFFMCKPVVTSPSSVSIWRSRVIRAAKRSRNDARIIDEVLSNARGRGGLSGTTGALSSRRSETSRWKAPARRSRSEQPICDLETGTVAPPPRGRAVGGARRHKCERRGSASATQPSRRLQAGGIQTSRLPAQVAVPLLQVLTLTDAHIWQRSVCRCGRRPVTATMTIGTCRHFPLVQTRAAAGHGRGRPRLGPPAGPPPQWAGARNWLSGLACSFCLVPSTPRRAPRQQLCSSQPGSVVAQRGSRTKAVGPIGTTPHFCQGKGWQRSRWPRQRCRMLTLCSLDGCCGACKTTRHPAGNGNGNGCVRCHCVAIGYQPYDAHVFCSSSGCQTSAHVLQCIPLAEKHWYTRQL